MEEKIKGSSKEKIKEKTSTKAKFLLQKIKDAISYLKAFAISIRDSYHIVIFGDFADVREGNDIRDRIRNNALPALSFFGAGVFSAFISLARFTGGIYPAGFALLSAVGIAEKGRYCRAGEKYLSAFGTALSLSVFTGALISCIFIEEHKLIYLLIYMALFLIRSALTNGKLNENLVARITFSAIFAASAGMIISAYEGFTAARLLGAVSLSVITPIICCFLSGFYLYSGGYMDASIKSRRLYLESAVACAVFLFLHSFNEFRLGGFSPSMILAVIAVLFISKKYGALYGTVMGCVCGLSAGAAQALPTLALAGFFSGIFFEYSSLLAFMMAFISACAYNIFSGSLFSFGEITSDMVAGMLIAYPLLRMVFSSQNDSADIAALPMNKEAEKTARRKLKNMSEAFSSLSEVFYAVSDTMKKPQYTEVSQLVSDVFARFCSNCPKSEECWGRNYSEMVDMGARISSKLLAESEISLADEKLLTKCPKSRDINDNINIRFSEINGNYYKNNKTRLLAGEYSIVSKLIKNTASEIGRELEYNPSLEGKAAKVLDSLGISYRKAAVFGSREMKIDIYGVSPEKINTNTDDIVENFEKEFGFYFDTPIFLMMEENAVMRLKRRRKFSLECAKSGCTKKGETINGDCTSFFETERDYFYTLICDGMGSGREAALTSRLASIFIEKLMRCASPKSITFDMLNTFLMSKSDETFTTIDLFEMDLLSGKADFIKAGAAPSFILRGDRIHKIESRSLPAGIIENVCAEKTSIPLKGGDYIIMTSDGVAADETGEWLLSLLSGGDFEGAADICDRIFEEAKERGGYSDDISISVIRVMNAK